MMNLSRHLTLHLWSEKRLWRLWHHSLLRDNTTLFLDTAPLLDTQSVRSPPRCEARNSAVPMRKTDLWRTDSNVPFCYRCGRPGHVLRYCSERRQIFADSRASRTCNPQRDADTESTQSFEDSYAQPTSSSFRSNSPYPRRSRYRRQSQSLYAAPAFLHIDPMRKTNSGDLFRR
ncbi:hypothetical protein AVEN_124898-1 [Araneus ventricosus]|uniref:CCHC-type domain-containing protein n=1 Tax=Araneus ventricosus TaxID=182803 RepID=A0A4Y2FY12_ARAVE|nr:hypothetical protein AVEN_124898-1 [Araneus ventricosus]